MKTRFFYLNENDEIEFSQEELKQLLDEVYEEGHKDGYDKGIKAKEISITTPSDWPSNYREWLTATPSYPPYNTPYYTTSNTPNSNPSGIITLNNTEAIIGKDIKDTQPVKKIQIGDNT